VTSAFGVEHTQRSKLAEARRKTHRTRMAKAVGAEYRQQMADRSVRRQARIDARPRKPYFNPSDEQKATTGARRTAQAAEKAGKQFRRVPGKKLSFAEHIHPGQVYNAALAGSAVLGGAALIHHDRKQLAKADHVKRDTAAGAVVGTAAVDTASVVGGQGLKAVLKERRVSRGESPADAKVWSAHKKSHGVEGRAGGSIPNSTKLKVYRSYPKALPDWRVQRALAVKNSPKFAAATLTGGAVTGALIAHHRAKRPLAKSDRGEKEAAAATVGAGAAQGAYQGVGYGTKHYVDRHTRKGGKGVTPEQVRLQDKTLKPLKSKYGMRLPHGDPKRDNTGYHRNYPKELPHGGTIRALGHTHEGKLGVAVGAGVTVVGGGTALLAARHRVNKLGPPKVHYREANIIRHNPKKNTTTRYGVDQMETRSDGKSLILRRPKYESGGMPSKRPKTGDYVSISPRRRVATPDARRIARAYESNANTITLTGGHTLKHHALGKSVIAKYDKGTITIHHEQAQLHARKKQSGRNQAAIGVGVAGAGVAAHAKAPDIAHGIGHLRANSWERKHGADSAIKPDLAGVMGREALPHVRTGAKVAIGAGAGLAAVGAARSIHHGHQQNVQTKKAQAARAERNASMAKSAFGVEDVRLEKFANPAELLEGGKDLMRGVQHGMGGGTAGFAGKGSGLLNAGAKIGAAPATAAGKLKATAIKNPLATVGAAGGAGLGAGALATSRKNH
jgi:hypothetical protein